MLSALASSTCGLVNIPATASVHSPYKKHTATATQSKNLNRRKLLIFVLICFAVWTENSLCRHMQVLISVKKTAASQVVLAIVLLVIMLMCLLSLFKISYVS